VPERRHGGDAPGGLKDFSAPMNPLGPPAWLLEEAGRALSRITRYPSPSYERLREAISLLHPHVDPGLVIPLNGAAEGFQLALTAIAIRGIVAIEPTFGDHRLAASILGLSYRPILLRVNGEGWRFEPEDACMLPPDTLRGALVMLSNPNNPTGSHTPPGALEALAGCLWERGAWLIVDEAFLRLSQRPGWSLAGRAPPNTLVLGSLTKDLAVPGLRLGYMIAHDRRVAEALDSVRQAWNVNSIAVAIGESLLYNVKNFNDHLEKARALIASEAPGILERLKAMGLEAWWGGPPYILVRHPSKPHPRFNMELHARGFHVRDASSFQGLDSTYSRISIRLPGENRALLEAIHEILSA
jgi:threonine-phosphate decarboxylase